MSTTIVDADGRPLSSGQTDPKDRRIAELEQLLEEARTANLRLQAKLAEDQVEMLVNLAIAEERALPALRPYLLNLGRHDLDKLREFIAGLPPIAGLNQIWRAS